MPSVPSLRIWVCSFAVVCILFGAFRLLAPDPVLLVLNYKRLFTDTPEKNSSTGKNQQVVSIGTSLMRHAIYYDDEMVTLARQKGYDNFSFTRFVLVAARLQQFYPLFDHIIAAKPDFVLFQSSLLAYKKPFKSKRHTQIHNYHLFLRKYSQYAVSGGNGFERYRQNREQQRALSLKAVEKRRSNSQIASKMKLLARRRKKWRLRKINKIPGKLDQFLRQAADAGIKVVILDLPLPEENKATLPGTEKRYARIIKKYEKKYRVKYLHYPHQLGLESFLDYKHMTPVARKKYVSWLLKQLSSQID